MLITSSQPLCHKLVSSRIFLCDELTGKEGWRGRESDGLLHGPAWNILQLLPVVFEVNINNGPGILSAYISQG